VAFHLVVHVQRLENKFNVCFLEFKKIKTIKYPLFVIYKFKLL